jgi:excisionase family DNA binding protein
MMDDTNAAGLPRPRLLDAHAVAEVLGCCYDTVHRLRRRGLLRAVALGGAWRFDPRDVEAYIEAQKTDVPSWAHRL